MGVPYYDVVYRVYNLGEGVIESQLLEELSLDIDERELERRIKEELKAWVMNFVREGWKCEESKHKPLSYICKRCLEIPHEWVKRLMGKEYCCDVVEISAEYRKFKIKVSG
jgi:hypothetical protein